jgi:hypothetical protein
VASCTVLKNWAKQKGRWVTAGYRQGDVVIFDWDGNGTTDHMGLVEAVSADGKTLTTIEGNTGSDNNSNGGQVMRRTRSIRYVNGAFRPKYEEDDNMTYDDFKKFMAQYEREKQILPASTWAAPVWTKAVSKNLVDGTMPQAPLTREAGIVLFDRLGMVK